MPYWAWIIIAVGLVVLVPILIQYIAIRSLKRSCRMSEGFLMGRLRYIVYVTGQVRAGKTTFAAGYTNIRTKYLMQKARKRIEFTCLAEPDVPFDKVDEILQEDFQNGKRGTSSGTRDFNPRKEKLALLRISRRRSSASGFFSYARVELISLQRGTKKSRLIVLGA